MEYTPAAVEECVDGGGTFLNNVEGSFEMLFFIYLLVLSLFSLLQHCD